MRMWCEGALEAQLQGEKLPWTEPWGDQEPEQHLEPL